MPHCGTGHTGTVISTFNPHVNRYFLVAECHGPPSDITRANPLEYSRSTPFGEAVGQFVACCLVKVLVKTIDSVAAAHAHNLACNVRRCPHGEEADDRRNLARKQKRASTRGGRGKRTTHWLVARTPVNGSNTEPKIQHDDRHVSSTDREYSTSTINGRGMQK